MIRRWFAAGHLRRPLPADLERFITAENEKFEQFQAKTSQLQHTLFDEAVSMLIPEGMSPPELNKGFFYFQRYDGDGRIKFCRVPADTSGGVMDIEKHNPLEEELLSVSEIAQRFSCNNFCEVSAAKISQGNDILGFITDLRGNEKWTLMFKNLISKEYLAVSTEYVRNFEWIDNPLIPGRFLYYTIMDPVTLRSTKVLRAHLNANGSLNNEKIVWELRSGDETSYVDLFKSKDGKCIFMSSSSKTSSEVYVVPSDDPEATPQLVHPVSEGTEYFCEHRDGYVYIVSNRDYVNFALYRMKLGCDSEAEFVYHSPDLTITDVDMFRKGLVLYGYGFEGQPAVEIFRFKGCVDESTVPEDVSDYDQFGVADIVKVPFKGNYAIGKLEIGINGDFEADSCRFTFRNPTNPGTCLQFNFETRKLEAVTSRAFQRKANVDMVLDRVGVPSADGQAVIPLTIVAPEDRADDRSTPSPCLVYVYGAYGQVLEPDFSPAVVSLVKRGWSVAFAHVRGGGERGPEWHKTAIKKNKWKSVVDLEACCHYLVAEKWTTPSLLCAVGASAGGVVLGSALNMFGKSLIGGAAILRVPFVDLVNTLADPDLPLSAHERDEWGNVDDEGEAAFIRSISPIDNIVDGGKNHYPPLLITCAEDDTRVPFQGVVRYARKLRQDARVEDLILRTSRAGEGGHFGSASAAGSYEDTCREIAFLLKTIDS